MKINRITNGRLKYKDKSILFTDRSGIVVYLLNGERHREDGPAAIFADGAKQYWLNGERHMEDGPAVIWPNGTEEYWKYGKLHREDGPAIVYAD